MESGIARLLDALAVEPRPPTKVVEREAALDLHVRDSLVGLEVAELADARQIGDIGSGAGFPGLALALALPQAHVDLIESNKRSCAVIDRLAAAAGIGNARAVPERAEDWARDDGRGAYDVVTARALAQLAVLVEYAAPLLEPGGVLVAWKGRRDPGEERAGEEAAAAVGLAARAVQAVQPFESARDRHLHVFEKVAETPERFPRRPGMAAKRPLAR